MLQTYEYDDHGDARLQHITRYTLILLTEYAAPWGWTNAERVGIGEM